MFQAIAGIDFSRLEDALPAFVTLVLIPLTLSITPADVSGVGQIGAQILPYEVKRIDPTFLQAVKMSGQQTLDQSTMILTTLKGLFTRDTPVKQLMGPVAIAELSGSAAQLGWLSLFGLMSMISLNLGILNLMPVPVLDGGHILIMALEGVARRRLQALFLADGGIARQCMRVGPDAGGRGDVAADGDHSAPLGELRAQLHILGTALGQAIQAFGHCLARTQGHVLGAGIDLDAGLLHDPVGEG